MFPKIWKKEKVILLPKLGKKDLSQTNYFVAENGEGLERTIVNRSMGPILQNNKKIK